MKHLIEEYGLSILIALVSFFLIGMCTPLGRITKNAISNVIDEYSGDAGERFSFTLFAGNGEFDDGSSVRTLTFLAEEEIGELPSPEYSGYVFDGWWSEANGGYEIESTLIAQKNMKIYAHWKADGTVYEKDTSNGISEGHLYIDGNDKGEFRKGTVFIWHGYHWTVLSVEENKALVVSTYVLDGNYSEDSWSDGIRFNIEANESLFNGKTVINAYKNSVLDAAMQEFCTDSKYLADDSAILDTSVSYGTYIGGETYPNSSLTRKVFALSYWEVRDYLEGESAKTAVNGNETYSWWTRTSHETEEAYMVLFNGIMANSSVTEKAGIRPAMYINMASAKNIEIVKE